MSINARSDNFRVELRAVFQPNADCPSVVGKNMRDGRLAADFDAEITARGGECH
jgi:hypothetical protein